MAFTLGVPDSSVERKKSDILDITDKITKALQDMDTLYDPKEEEGLLYEISEQVDGLAPGQLKYQLKSFINNYKDMTSHVTEANEEKDVMMNSLAEWFAEQELPEMATLRTTMTDNELDEQDREMRDRMMDTKFAFEKMKELGREIQLRESMGEDTADLISEKSMLQRDAMVSFKEYQEASKETSTAKSADAELLQGAWKQAANEICQLLHNVRDKGTDYVKELESSVHDLLKQSEKYTHELVKLDRRLKEKELMERKWKEDNAILTTEKAKLDAKLKKVMQELKHARQHPGGTEMVKTEYGVGRIDQSFEGSRGGYDDTTILKQKVKDSKRQIEKLTQNNTELEEAKEEFDEIIQDKV